MELFYAGSRLVWEMQVHLSLLTAVRRFLQRSFVRKVSSFLREISCQKKKKEFSERGKVFQKEKKNLQLQYWNRNLKDGLYFQYCNWLCGLWQITSAFLFTTINKIWAVLFLLNCLKAIDLSFKTGWLTLGVICEVLRRQVHEHLKEIYRPKSLLVFLIRNAN